MTLMMVAGFEHPTSGTIELDEKDRTPEALPPQYRSGVSELRALRAHGSFAGRYPRELSGGQQQRSRSRAGWSSARIP